MKFSTIILLIFFNISQCAEQNSIEEYNSQFEPGEIITIKNYTNTTFSIYICSYESSRSQVYFFKDKYIFQPKEEIIIELWQIYNKYKVDYFCILFNEYPWVPLKFVFHAGGNYGVYENKKGFDLFELQCTT